jgi:predicted ATPase
MTKSLQEVGAIRRSGNRYLLTRPLEEIIVPDTIQDVLMARIDRLEETTKRTLQTASVIGREFSYRRSMSPPPCAGKRKATVNQISK